MILNKAKKRENLSHESETPQTILLPEDVMEYEIYKYIPITTLYVLSKELFEKLYPKIIERYAINSNIFQRYIRHLIRKDSIFQIRYLLDIRAVKWCKPVNWKYQKNTYPSYLVFLKLLSINYDSDKCKELINNYLDNSLSEKKRYKKIRSKNYKWSN